MEVNKWKGLITAASPYSLPPEAATRQHNIQIRKVGQLVPRQGMDSIFQSRYGSLLNAHRLTGGSSASDKLLVFRENQINTLDYTLEVISTSGTGLASSEVFSTASLPANRPSFCEDRHGTAYVFFGSGVRPQILRKGDTATLPCGIEAPTIAPTVEGQGDGFFIERVDVLSSGTSYFRPPALTVTGGGADRQAEIRAVIQGGSIVAVDVIDGGSNYKTMPTITVSNEQVGIGFLAVGIVASGAAQYGFKTSDTATTSGSYTTGWTHASSTTAFPAKIAYRLPPNYATTYEADVVFDSSTTPPNYVVTIPLASTTAAATTTASVINAGSPIISVASATNISVGTELLIDSTYFTPNPVVISVNTGTSPPQLTLDRTANHTLQSGTVAVTGVSPTGTYATMKFSSISSGWKIGGTYPWKQFVEGNGIANYTTSKTDASGTLAYTGKRSSWYTGTDAAKPYFEDNAGSGWSAVTLNKDNNKDYFWALMPSPSGRKFAHNMIGYIDGSTFNYYDFYFPSYNSIGVRMLTGTEAQAGTESAWTVVEAPIKLQQISITSGGLTTFYWSPFIDLTLRPLKKDDGTAYTRLAETQDPQIRVYLAGCPESWKLDGPGDAGWESPGRTPLPFIYLRPSGNTLVTVEYTTAHPYQLNQYIYIEFDGGLPNGVYRVYTVSTYTISILSTGSTPVSGTGNSSYQNHLKWYSPQIGRYRRNRASDTRTGPADLTPGNNGAIAPLFNAASGWYYNTTDSRVTQGTRWWAQYESFNEALPPVVDFRLDNTYVGMSSGTDSKTKGIGVAAGTIQFLNEGKQLERGTKYWLRFEQYNSYDYEGVSASYRDTWRSGSEQPADRAYPTTSMSRKGAFGSTYTDFYFQANDLDTTGSSALLLLPGQVLNDPVVTITGRGWGNSQTAAFRLRQQNPNATTPSSTATDSITYTFTAKEIVAATTTQRIGDVQIVSRGSNYYRAPTVLSRDGGGYGLRVSANVQDGQVQTVTVLEGGDGYTSSPVLYTSVEPASLLPVLRGTMQGTYRCAYRYADYSQTKIADVLISTTSGSTTATLSASSTLIKPGMRITGHTGIAHMAKIVSVNGTSLTLSKAATAGVTASAATSTSAAVGAAVIRDMELPVTYSDFSPIVDVDADVNGSGRASRFVWSLANVTPPNRADYIEFYRTSGDQSLVFYRLDQYATVAGGLITIVGSDGQSDEELFDIDRPNYAALPVVLPNGGLNAYRFGLARSDMAAAVAFQDRLWYGVSTSGNDTNTVFFSEYDEFESCPDVNEIPIQNNLRTTDYLTALVPFGSVLLAMQTSHAYSINYNTDPAVDPVVQLQAHRGCLCQQAWDVFDDLLYVADERGIYRMTRSGDVENLSDPIRNLFDEGGIDFTYRKNFFLKVDQVAGVLRFFFTPTGVSSEYPTRAVCFHIANQAWWTEGWPNALTCATDYRATTGRERSVYGSVDGGLYQFGGTRDCSYRDIQGVTVTNGGSGYITPPTVTVTSASGRGAVLQAIISEGSVTEVLVVESGYGYGSLSGSTFTNSVTLSFSAPPSGTTATGSATARHPWSDTNAADSPPNETTVGWQYRTGPMAILGEHNAKGGDGLMDRSVTVTYQPTATPKTLLLREYYNNSPYPRANVMRRDRGTGWVHETSGSRATLDMSASRSPLGLSTGQAKAMFAGRSLSDIGSADKHLAVELSCEAALDNSATDPPEALIYALTVNGVADGD